MNARLTLVTTAAMLLTAAAVAVAQVPTPSVPVAARIAMPAPVASVSPVAAPAAPVAPIASLSPVAQVAPVAPVAARASADAFDAPEAPQAPPAQSPDVVATTPQATPKVVRPTVDYSARVTWNAVGEDPQTPPAPPAPPVPSQAPQAPPVPQASPRFQGPTSPLLAPRAEMPKVQAPRMVRGQLINLRLEFTITDQIGTATPVKKTVIMNVADGESGRIRTNADVYRKAGNSGSFTNVPLSIDASPELDGTKIRLKASLEYQLLNDAASADVPGGKTSITQAVTSVLNDGVSAILCQSADPLTDRKVTLEVKATIVK
jgi:hypothetical protein